MILVAIGANLPGPGGRTPQATCLWAADRLAGLPAMGRAAVSRWYTTAPVPPAPQPDYVNGVIRLEGHADPRALLAALHAIEAEAGRERGLPNAARTLDLDLLAVGDLVIHGADLVLPHPRLQERAFVLAPLCDVAPGWRHPVLGRTAAEIFAALPAPASTSASAAVAVAVAVAVAAKHLPPASPSPISTLHIDRSHGG